MPIISGSGTGGGAVSGVTVTGTAASGQVPVASSSAAGQWKYPPGFEIGYDAITAPVSIVSTTEATGTTVITCAAHTFDGAAVLAQFFGILRGDNTAVGDLTVISLFEGATQITELVTYRPGITATTGFVPATALFRFTPTAASHTYTITGFATNAAGGASVQAGVGGTGANPPAFVRFTKV